MTDDEPVISGNHYSNCKHLTFKDAEFIRDCWESMGKQKDPEVVQLLKDKFELTDRVLRNIVNFRSLAQPPGYSDWTRTDRERDVGGGRDRRSADEQAAEYALNEQKWPEDSESRNQGFRY